MSTPNDTVEDSKVLALRALALKVLQSRVAEAVAINKSQLEAAMQPGDSKKPTLPGTRQRLGTVGYSAGAMRAGITDPEALANWAIEHGYSEATEITVTLKPWFEKQVLDNSKKAEQPCGPGGELDVPGITVKVGEPFISVRPDGKVDDYTWSALLSQAQMIAELTGADEQVVDAEIVEDDEAEQ